MNKIQKVEVFNSTVNHHDGNDICPGFAVIIEPHPTSEDDILWWRRQLETHLTGLNWRMNDEI